MSDKSTSIAMLLKPMPSLSPDVREALAWKPKTLNLRKKMRGATLKFASPSTVPCEPRENEALAV
jgi:hypothetical protein